jgi:hypothetical protein
MYGVALQEATWAARDGRRVTVSGKPLQPTCFLSGDDTADRRCANSAKRIRDHMCGW